MFNFNRIAFNANTVHFDRLHRRQRHRRAAGQIEMRAVPRAFDDAFPIFAQHCSFGERRFRQLELLLRQCLGRPQFELDVLL